MTISVPSSKSIALALLVSALPLPGLAHTTQVSGDVAATWHVEPNHAPQAGKPAEVWIALTREGGAILPLAECDCRLAVYAEPRQPEDAPLLEPPLEAIAAERYAGIPGADLVFPQPGQYQLQLTGAPKADEAFQPFEFQYSVIVATGTAAPSPTVAESPAEAAVTDRNRVGLWALLALAACCGLLVVARSQRRKK